MGGDGVVGVVVLIVRLRDSKIAGLEINPSVYHMTAHPALASWQDVVFRRNLTISWLFLI